jgi:elongation factor G
MRLAARDPHCGVRRDIEGNWNLLARDPFTLEDKASRLRQEFGETFCFGPLAVIGRTTITRRIEVDFTFKRQMGGHGAFARVKLVFEPAEPGTGLTFRSDVVSGAVPDDFIPGVVSGLDFAWESHELDGFFAMDVHAVLVDGAFHDVDSSRVTFDMAARGAFAELRKAAEFKRFEPIMAVTVATSAGDVVAVRRDLIERGGMMIGEALRGDVVFVAGEAPLASLLDYVDRLRVLSEGRARLSRMDFSRFAEIPQSDVPDGVFPPAIGMRLVGHASVTASSA